MKSFFLKGKKNLSSEDQQFFTTKLQKMKRRKAREFGKHRKSFKWNKMNKQYKIELHNAKKNFYDAKIKELLKAKPKHWHRELKRLTGFDKNSSEELIVEAIKDLPNKVQAELIADKFASVSQEFEKLTDEDITVPEFNENDIPIVTSEEVTETLSQIDANKSSVKGDIPAKLLKHFAYQVAIPFTDIINSSIKESCWPDIFKLEVVTPIPKVPKPKTIDELRNISGLLK